MMEVFAQYILGLCFAWAVLASVVQVAIAWGGGRQDYSVPLGSRMKGMLYSFTGAMLPSRKESISGHKISFAIGIIFHTGLFLCLFNLLLAIAKPGMAWSLRYIFILFAGLGLVAGIYLFIRRMASAGLRAMSAADDFIANAITTGLLAMTLVYYGYHPDAKTALWLYSALLFLYFPLGKLRHAIFFFTARGDLGRRLGYRGTYPPIKLRETSDGGK